MDGLNHGASMYTPHMDGHQQGFGNGSEDRSSGSLQDHPMEDDASMSTVTASTVQPFSSMYQSYNGGQPTDQRPQTSYSDTGFSRSYAPHSSESNSSYQQFSPQQEDAAPRQMYGDPVRSMSRPSSGLAGSMGQERYGTSEGMNRSTYEQKHRPSQPQPDSAGKNTSVVIKVGMVGDAQIGKTSLMVKYVEGSWDEDYIQTLGISAHPRHPTGS